ncbi:hypothetical protein BAOM_p029 (plasmid) [Peribacillus asahii]|uniref:Uncharacterized protein n=1 Tax=Peribacillus asahii TaxID=228899 RepID=A0A3T0KZD5_9BACI|nr:hypothetical protein BAOM_p029 [Peribacillus asahii]
MKNEDEELSAEWKVYLSINKEWWASIHWVFFLLSKRVVI